MKKERIGYAMMFRLTDWYEGLKTLRSTRTCDVIGVHVRVENILQCQAQVIDQLRVSVSKYKWKEVKRVSSDK